MNKALHKRIKVISLSAMAVFTIAAFIGIGITFEKNEDLGINIMISWIIIMVLPLISIITSYSIMHQEKGWIRKIAKYTLYVYPVILFAGVGLIAINIIVLIIVGIILLILATFLALMHLFIFTSPVSITSTIIFLSLIIVGIVFKRLHLPLAGTILTLSLMLFSLGCYIYGVRCLFLVEKNKYLKYVMFVGNCIVAISLTGMLFKTQHWPGGNLLVYSGWVTLVLGTIVVLFTLPSTGFVEWQTFHKKIMNRLILPWSLIFLLFIIKFLLPEVDALIWPQKRIYVSPGFEMTDYELEIRDNPKSE